MTSSSLNVAGTATDLATYVTASGLESNTKAVINNRLSGYTGSVGLLLQVNLATNSTDTEYCSIQVSITPTTVL